MKALLKNIDENGERWLLLFFYSTIVITIAMEVLRRFVFSYSSIWGEEVARYAFIYLAWIGASAAVKERAHIRIDVLLHYLPQRGKAVVYLFGDLMTTIVALFAFYWSIHPIEISLKFGSVTHGLGISQAWFMAAVPLGFSLMLFRLAQSIRRDTRSLIHGTPVFEGNKLFD
ncbi:TRAP transporter small permease [Enterovibrio norvegicus]|uniref:TRAP transporter small permease protein n=2 Tax=Enterovibrio norvegicus TaxID=188144 RepID=A0A1I5K7T2_9GAMM|nr:TRAP transporter small permease [Enterovibrio norvegicus]MCC4798076.1 TRAP transporter small permease [Enterovibrio norvegicus]OEE63719.1 C4-dicarboxylate ABC transporter [Enterovibrio norvegicus]OEF51747.1 C4-dicarboxylate ABC transporter [Enterovibrio norvegicus]OEF55851.1 C4-dicarboxylate ABC transporter [Enterovibrio norvegicus]OEF61499.1 C4-dicarboxylate ABC transporter [Enterovibrio norvegicus]